MALVDEKIHHYPFHICYSLPLVIHTPIGKASIMEVSLTCLNVDPPDNGGDNPSTIDDANHGDDPNLLQPGC